MTKRIAPLVDKLLLGFLTVGAGLIPLVLFADWQLIPRYLNLLGLLSPFFITGSGIVCWLRGFRPARLFVLATAFTYIGAFLTVLTAMGLLPPTFWGREGFQIGSALEAIVLSLALVDRMQTLRQEREVMLQAKAQAEGAMRESERRFRAIFDQTFQFIGLSSPDGTLLECNKTALDFINAEEPDVLGKLFWETPWWVRTPEEQARVRDAIKDAAQGQFVRFETMILAPDGGSLHFDFSIKPMRGEAGKVALLILEARDRTDYRRTEEALRESEDKYRTIFDTSGTAMLMFEDDAIITEINKEFERLSGYTYEEVCGSLPI